MHATADTCTHGGTASPHTSPAHGSDDRPLCCQYEMWVVIRYLASFFAMSVFGMFYLQATNSAQDDKQTFDYSLMTIILGIFSGTILTSLGVSPAALRNMIHMTISKPFYVGDLISVHSGTSNKVASSINGLVENFTFQHIVIRSFDNKQVWISHEEFEKLSVSNWTRRPGKQVMMEVIPKFTSDPDDVRTLAIWIRTWIKASDGINQEVYQKGHLKKVEEGFIIQVIFTTKIGMSSKKVKEAFTHDLGVAAQRLGIVLVPKGHINSASNYGVVGRDRNPDAGPRLTVDALKSDIFPPKLANPRSDDERQSARKSVAEARKSVAEARKSAVAARKSAVAAQSVAPPEDAPAPTDASPTAAPPADAPLPTNQPPSAANV